ncbi:hypothetical protein MAHJHV35_48270 [Mycobacterium avium subsp. hominissuis]
MRSLSENDFRDVPPAAGWEISYLGPTTYQVNLSAETIQMMAALQPRLHRAEALQQLRRLVGHVGIAGGRVHAPFWEVHATRVD